MKRKFCCWFIVIGGLILTNSCGKYGYHFTDGYQSGDSLASPITTDTTMFKADKSLYNKARIYPGLVGDNVKRITSDTTVVFDMSPKVIPASAYKIQSAPVAAYSSGLYAPAGENVRIIVPEGMIGLTAQIGVHRDNISGKDAPRRDAVIFTTKELFPGINYVKNLYGGTIWIYSNVSRPQPVSLKFSGAVRASDFVLGKSNMTDWKKDVIANDVPWLELRAHRTIFSVPRSLILKFIQSGKADGVEQALNLWDKTYENDYYNWMGLSPSDPNLINHYPELPERGVMDIHPSAGYAHSGNPWVMQEDDYWMDELINPVTVASGTSWGTYHEVGHNYQQVRSWSWSDLGETTNNLFVFNAARNRNVTSRIDFHPALKDLIPISLSFAAKAGSKNFSDLDGVVESGAAPFFRLTPFLQIFDKAIGKNGEKGWDFFPFIYKASRNENIELSFDQAKKDYFYRKLCQFTGRDYQRFFTAWGISLSGLVKREMRNLYPPMEKAIWTYNPLTYTGGDQSVPPRYDLARDDFSFTSNAATATNESTGTFKALTDGNINTYWHTCYSGCSIPTTLPVNIIMDMKDQNAFKGFFIQNRQGTTYQTAVRVYVSKDGVNWTSKGSYDLAKSSETTAQRNARRDFTFDSIVEARYVKFEFTQPNLDGQVHVALSEIGVFYDI